jgi:hypothetical protein
MGRDDIMSLKSFGIALKLLLEIRANEEKPQPASPKERNR